MVRLRAVFLDRYGPWALVTGASSGLGEAFARELAARGFNLVLAARRRDRLEALAAALRIEHGTEARPVAVDLADESFMTVLDPALAGTDLGLVVSNAGVGSRGPFLAEEPQARLRMLHTNCRAPLILADALLPRLAARGRGGFLLTSSLAAFLGIPFHAHYAATKGYDLQLAEALWYELRPQGVDVTALCPGPVDTEGRRRNWSGARTLPVSVMDPATVARAGLDALGRGPLVVPGLSNRLLGLLVRLAPRRVATAVSGRTILRAIS